MENLVMENKNNIKKSFGGMFEGKRVLVTGHTGFKGSWLSIWLNALGAKVIGYSIDIPTTPSNFEITKLKDKIIDIRGDVRDYKRVLEVIQEHKPEIIFHLAAQPIILTGIKEPERTFNTNVVGTLNILEAVRHCSFVKAVVSITSDKCYKNQESIWGYKESDLLGGEDPYSASKAMAEILIESYQKSYFNKQENLAGVASVRAGNVIGGGDFAEFRLVPDAMKALIDNKEIILRNPRSVRPWQHVLIPLSGYLAVAQNLIKDKKIFAHAWNFGPKEVNGVTTGEIVEKIISIWGEGKYSVAQQTGEKIETALLKLNWEKAASMLKWFPAYDIDDSLSETVRWFKAYKESCSANSKVNMLDLCEEQISKYTLTAENKKMNWAI